LGRVSTGSYGNRSYQKEWTYRRNSACLFRPGYRNISSEGKIVAIEVKAESMKRVKIPPGLRSFIKSYHPYTVLVLNRDLDTKNSIEDVKVRYVPLRNWLHSLSEIFTDNNKEE
jgi:hypothetical protein